MPGCGPARHDEAVPSSLFHLIWTGVLPLAPHSYLVTTLLAMMKPCPPFSCTSLLPDDHPARHDEAVPLSLLHLIPVW